MSLPPEEWANRTVLVTGASSGIGRETAIVLSQFGARVIVAGRNDERLRQTLLLLEGGGQRATSFDLTALEAIGGWFADLGSDPLYGIVHSAGISSGGPVSSLNVARLEEIWRVNVGAGAMLAKALRRQGRSNSPRSVVFISSVMGLVGTAGASAYCGAKAGLIGLTRALAVELSRDGIRVNCVAPGYVRTTMLDELRDALGEERYLAVEKAHPLGLGTPRDVAAAAAFLLGDSARWITGAVLPVDGGYTAQ